MTQLFQGVGKHEFTPADRAAYGVFTRQLDSVLAILIARPIATDTAMSQSDTAHRLQRLEQRQAYVKIGAAAQDMHTKEIPAFCSPGEERRRQAQIIDQTRAKYCRPAQEVAWEIRERLDEIELDEHEEPEPEPEPEREPEREPEQSPSELVPASKDTINLLYAQMKAKEIDPDTTILAALGEHYVMTIKQWMRLFEWGSYPRATKYFKELREQGLIYHKDREGRGGTLVAGDWFFLLTKGANELVKRKQATPLFKLEPNEAERASGDTLVHTYLVNEVLIRLRLLERARPGIVTIEQIDHERSMRRDYLVALGADSKLYPDGFLRLLVPTQNGLKRRYTFLELQNTTQKDGANWKTKCRKYLALFERADILEQFFHTRTPYVLVITMNAEYVLYHKQWTEEVLAEQADRGRRYSNRFLIGEFDTGISDMSMTPTQYFCTPRFSTPFQDAPQAVFDS